MPAMDMIDMSNFAVGFFRVSSKKVKKKPLLVSGGNVNFMHI